MDQAGLAASLNVFQRLFFSYPAPKLGIDPQGCISKEEAALIDRVILTFTCLATDTDIHDPVNAGLFDEMIDNL